VWGGFLFVFSLFPFFFFFLVIHVLLFFAQAAHDCVSVEFEDGLQYQPEARRVRTLLDKPLVATPPRGWAGGFGKGERPGTHRGQAANRWVLYLCGVC